MSSAEERLAAIASLCGGGNAIPLDPAANFYARGGAASPMQFSSGWTALPTLPNAAEIDESQNWTPLLKLNVATGAPRVWTVRVALSDGESEVGLSGPWYKQGLRARVSWSQGQNNDSAIIDIRSGAIVFPLTADAIQVDAQNGIRSFAQPRSFKAQCAISSFSLSGDWRVPTRTQTFYVEPGGANSPLIPIPRHSQQVSLIGMPPTGTEVAFYDSDGTTVAQATITSRQALDIPAGAASLQVTGPASYATGYTCAVIWRLGF